MTLPSNSSQVFYPNNTLTHYTTHLPTSITLSGDWECSLCEFSFPATWYPVKPIIKMSLTVKRDPSGVEMTALTEEFSVDSAYCVVIESLIQYINSRLESIIDASKLPFARRQYPMFKYDSNNQKVFARLGYGMHISMTPDLSRILGFEQWIFPPVVTDIENPQWTSAQNVIRIIPNRDVEIQNIYVYCDIVENVIVGDTQAPLLRIVDATSRPNEVIYRHYDAPRYIPVPKKHFDSIEIDIRDDFGGHIPFESGKLVTTLHFRQAINSYFL